MSYSNKFETAFVETVLLEGGYVNDPDDSGGETKYGISRTSHPGEDIANLSMERAKEIYHECYWRPLRLDELRGDVAAEVFDTAVNMGIRTATEIAQEAANYFDAHLVVDGKMGVLTITALNRVAGPDLLKVLNGLQLARYVALVKDNPERGKFARGWLKRIQVVPV